jgi:hypothetical protein
MSEELNLTTFSAISKFVGDLGELYGKRQRSLTLYKRLIKKTSICNEKPIKKHIDAFRVFCVNNREAIRTKDSRKINENFSIIKYSETAQIDVKTIFVFVSKEEDKKDADDIRENIWKHLLTISALVDPAGKAKEILKESASRTNNTGGEVDFIANIIDKVENTVDPGANPMEAVSSIMQSGIFTDLITDMNSGLQNGNLDLSKLMGAVTGMVSTIGQQSGGEQSGGEQSGQNADAMNMLNSMMGSFMSGMQPPQLPPQLPPSSSKEKSMDDVE